MLTKDQVIAESEVEDGMRPFQPFGAARELWWCDADEVLLAGPAGTGKSRAALERLHFCAETYPGMRGLILRQTRESLTDSALVTFEDKVLPEGHPALGGIARENRREYRYPNGSSIVVGGLRKSGRNVTEKVMSTEYDIIYIQEAIELEEQDWEKATTRLRNNRMPFQQLIADTNPSAPTHWLKKRCDNGKTVLLESRHEDNPMIWDRAVGQATGIGQQYLKKLDALTGPRYERLRLGRWVQAEGVVYPEYDARIHRITLPKAIRMDWPRYMSVDFGFSNPFVAQWWAKDFDGRLYLYRQIYWSQRIVEDHAKEIRRLSANEPAPQVVVCDHDAEDTATLRKYLPKWQIVPAKKNIKQGIEAVKARLRPAEDGKPRLYFVMDSLVQRDHELLGRPQSTEEEMDAYIMDASEPPKDVPIKENDHGMDAMRYMVAYFDLRVKAAYKPKMIIPGANSRQQTIWG